MEKISPYIKSFGMSFMSMACILSLSNVPATLASDHVDSPSVTVSGPTYAAPSANDSAKPSVASGKPEDITDVYTFREGDQTGNPSDNDKLCVVMTLNGLQAPGQGRPFAPDVAYQIKIATDKNDLDSTTNTRTLNFRFGLPNQNTGVQEIYLTDSAAASVTGSNSIGFTTAFNESANSNTVSGGMNDGMKVFAGETDDPFFLDFRIINEGLAHGVNGAGSTFPNRTPGDTFNASNVNAIVVSIPTTSLPTPMVANTYYVWGRTLK